MSVHFQGHRVDDSIIQALLDECMKEGYVSESRPYKDLDEIDRSVVRYSLMHQLLLSKKFESLRTLLKYVPLNEVKEANLENVSLTKRWVEPIAILLELKAIEQARHDELVGRIKRAASFRSLPKA